MNTHVLHGRPRATRTTAAAVLVALGVATLSLGSPRANAEPVRARTSTNDTSGRDSAEATTVPAPEAGDGATVTVSRTTELVNQTVAVSWTGFEPSSANRLENSGDSLDVNTENPVRVYQCRGTDPASSSECYGAPGFRGIDPGEDGEGGVDPVPAYTYPGQQDVYDATPDGPANWQDNITRADGTGEVAIQLFTKRESSSLGCNADSPCSIVVVPNYGRDGGAGDTEDLMDAPWAWARRTVVPLEFLPVDDACPLTGTSLRVEGSPVASHALASWRARTCTLASKPVRVDYTAIGEPQTRGDLASGTTDVGLVIDPLDAEAAKSRGVVYAPVALTSFVVAFQIDDADGKPITQLNLNPRLVAKLITASYRSGGNPAVINNPVNIFRDPELKELNPGVDFPGGAPGNHPLLLGDLSDTTIALTRWIEADKEARDFLAGKPDPWGMTVNTNYKGVDLPFAGFPLLDPKMSETFEPIQELDALSRQLSIARFPGALVTQEGGVNIVTKPPRQNPGRREVIGIIDAASAARFRLATASLENGAGQFVAPSDAGLIAAASTAEVNPDGVTRSVDMRSKNPAVYPLTLLVSAALSTQADAEERAAMVNLLDYVGGEGQQPGEEVGELPDGNTPLPKDLLADLRTARAAVAKGSKPATDPGTTDPGDGDGGDGDGTTDPGTDTGTDPGTTDPSDAPSDGGDDPLSTQGVVPDTGAPESGEPTTTDDTPTPGAGEQVDQAGQEQFVTVGGTPALPRSMFLPLLGLVGLLGIAAGATLIWLNRTGRGPQWLRR